MDGGTDVVLFGHLVKAPEQIKYEPEMYSAVIAVNRKSVLIDFVDLVIPSVLMENKKIKFGPCIRVIGKLRSRQSIECGCTRLKIYVYANAIELTEKLEECSQYVQITGAIKKTPVIKEFSNGHVVTTLSLSVDRYGNEKVFDCLPCVFWSGGAKSASFLRTGDIVSVNGRLQSRIYFDKKTERDRMIHEVAVKHFKVIQRKGRMIDGKNID